MISNDDSDLTIAIMMVMMTVIVLPRMVSNHQY